MNEEGWDCFLELIQQAENKTILSELLDLLLTPEEKNSVETRCLIIKALLEKKAPQRQIAEELNVSIAKITRGSNELKRKHQVKLYLQRLFNLVP